MPPHPTLAGCLSATYHRDHLARELMTGLVGLVMWLAAAAPHKTRIAVLDVKGAQDVQAKAALLTPVIVSEFARKPELTIISSSEIAATLGMARQRELLG